MSKTILVTEVTFTAALRKDLKGGLIGWTSFVVNGALKLDSVAVRRTADHRLVLSFPARTDGAGRQRFYFRPLDTRTRKEIERQVCAQLRITEAARR